MTNHCSGEITFRNSFQGPNIFIYLLLFIYANHLFIYANHRQKDIASYCHLLNYCQIWFSGNRA